MVGVENCGGDEGSQAIGHRRWGREFDPPPRAWCGGRSAACLSPQDSGSQARARGRGAAEQGARESAGSGVKGGVCRPHVRILRLCMPGSGTRGSSASPGLASRGTTQRPLRPRVWLLAGGGWGRAEVSGACPAHSTVISAVAVAPTPERREQGRGVGTGPSCSAEWAGGPLK